MSCGVELSVLRIISTLQVGNTLVTTDLGYHHISSHLNIFCLAAAENAAGLFPVNVHLEMIFAQLISSTQPPVKIII